MRFEEIVLSNDELALLRRLNARPYRVAECDRRAVDRLARLQFALYCYCIPTEKYKTPAERKSVRISEKGRDYLMWLDGQEADSRRNFRENLLFALIGAVGGSLFTLAVEHFGEIVSFLCGLFQHG